MFSKYIKLTASYGLILAAGLGIGWAAPRVYTWLKPTHSDGDFSAYYAGTATNVVVYGTPTCPYCLKTRAYLKERQIAFTDLDVTTNEKARKELESLGTQNVPVILIGRRRINGFIPNALQDALEAAGHTSLALAK